MKKAMTIIIIIGVMLIGALFTYTYLFSKEASKAIEGNERIELCIKVLSDKERNECYSQIASQTKNAQLCDETKGRYERDKCLKNIYP